MPREAVRYGRAERKRDRGREHPHEPDEPDGRGAAVVVGPDGDGEERRPFDHEKPAPRELEAPEVPVPEDVLDGADLVGKSMSEAADRLILSALRVYGRQRREAPVFTMHRKPRKEGRAMTPSNELGREGLHPVVRGERSSGSTRSR